MLHLFLSTVALRPYVFVFLAAFLFASTVNYGLLTTLLFAAMTYAIALGCEWSSVHNGFPFGLYHYVHATQGREIWVAGVPLMDSLSFTFLAFASYTVAMLWCSPISVRGFDLRLLDTWSIRRSPRVWLLSAMFMVMVDMVVDPLSVRGNRWFLGRLFWYAVPGPHFGVPISNYLGWFLIATLSIGGFQALDSRLNRSGRKPTGLVPGMPSRALLGPGLYAGIVGFGVAMLFWIRAYEVAWASVFIFLPVAALTLHILTRAETRGTGAALASHAEDFPYDGLYLPKAATKACESAAQQRRSA